MDSSSIGRKFSYLCSYKSNFDRLEEEIEKLKETREIVQRRVDVAERRGEEIGASVEKWLISVNKVVDEAGRVVADEEKGKKKCFSGLCSNFKNRYQVSKKAVGKVKAVVELREKGKFDKISIGTIPEDRLLGYAKGLEASKSRKSILNDILDALSNDNVSKVGLYGMGGIGKTTLAKEVARQVKEDKLFDGVVFAEVSQTPDVKRIQGQIADQLDLKFCEESESERAMILCDRLKKENKTLVILDNIWTGLDLERVGIPLGGDQWGCKVLMTSRLLYVLSNDMGSQKNFLVSGLTNEEAWSLFLEMAGDYIDTPDLQPVAIDVASICAGWPIVIVTVARALRNKSVVEWKDALHKLRSSSLINFSNVHPLVHSAIELSYYHLGDQEAKSTFLLCSLIKHPYDAPIMDLLKYGVGLGLFNDSKTLEETRDRVHALVRKLKSSSLLCDGHKSEWLSMHDVVRDVAISVASREQHIFSLQNEVVQREWLGKDTLKTCTAISLHDINIMELPEGLECPQLKFFYVNSKDSFCKIPDNFFAGMTELRVVVLKKMQLLFLPLSFHLLVNLQTLCLDQCILGDIANVGNLKKLQILSLCCSNIEHLPGEIGQLTGLRLLDLSSCPKLKVISPNVISRLSQLEELYMGNTSVEWEFEGLNIDCNNNASLNELQHLCRLTCLEIHIQDAKILPKGLFSKTLKRYKIFIGDEWDWLGDYENTKTLKLKLNTNVCLEDEVIMQLKGIEGLYLDEVQGVENILWKLDRAGFPQLKYLHVQNNPYILHIVDSSESLPCDTFPVLESLSLRNLMNLDKICHGQLRMGSFAKLRIMKVGNCAKLKNIFSFSMVRGLAQLQTFKVNKCKNMEEIIAATERKDGVSYDEVIDTIELGQLRSLSLKFLPQLTSFCSKVKTPSTSHKRHKQLTTGSLSDEITSKDELYTRISLFNKKVVFFHNLEALELCAINFEKIWQNELASCFQNLTRLIVRSCDKLKYLFSSSIVRNFARLQHLEVCYCTALEEIVSMEVGAGATPKFVFPYVTFLKLWNLPNLRTFYPGLHISEWPLLKRLEVSGCDKVKIFSKSTGFQQTEKAQLTIPAERALFLVEKVIPNLEELKLSGKDIKLICQLQFPQHLFHKIKILEIVNDESANLPLGFLQRFHNQEKLELRWSSYKEIFSYLDVEKHAGMLTQLKSLKLWKLSNLKHMWEQDSKRGSIAQNLEVLKIWWCDNLINLVPNLTSFQNLTILEVWHCKRLMTLLTLSTAKSLVQLVNMRIDGCQMVTEIIANEGGVAEDEIIFSKLKRLSLERLESLTSFCSCNYTLKFPSLEDLFVIECPKMEIFSNGVLSTPMLQEVQHDREPDKGRWEGDLNKTVQQLHAEKMLFHAQQQLVVLQHPQIDPSFQGWLKSSVTQAKEKGIQTKLPAMEKPVQALDKDIIDTSTKLKGKGYDVQAMDAPDSGRGLSIKKERSRHTVRASSAQIALDDGYCWRKYGQKDIMGSKFPRSYYRCAHRNSSGCLATKQVQQLDNDPSSFEITSFGVHTCPVSSTVPSVSPLLAKIPQEMTQRQASGVLQPPSIAASFQEGLKYDVTQAKKQVIQTEHSTMEIPFANRVQLFGKDIIGTPTKSTCEGEHVQAMDAPGSGRGLSLKKVQSRHTVRVSSAQIALGDGYTWKKYGQKDILGSKFPRSYYRCAHRNLYQCLAKKNVQQLDNDPFFFQVTYCDVHTCPVPLVSPLSANITQEMTQCQPPRPTAPLALPSSAKITKRKTSLRTPVPIAPLVIRWSAKITKEMTRQKTSLRTPVPIAPLIIPSPAKITEEINQSKTSLQSPKLTFTFDDLLSGSTNIISGGSIVSSMAAGGDGGGADLFLFGCDREATDECLESKAADELFFQIWLQQ